MQTKQTSTNEVVGKDGRQAASPLDPLSAYLLDAVQRTVLFWDVLRQRGNQYLEHMAQQAPHVLQFEAELVRRRPQAAAAGQLRPGPDHAAGRRHGRAAQAAVRRGRPARRPRARHRRLQGRQRDRRGAGRRPSLLLRRLPARARCPARRSRTSWTPRPRSSSEVIELHPEAEGKPVVIGNCQGGWAVMMVAATRPELFGPIIVAGAPLSYWAGVRGKQPDALLRRAATAAAG